MTTVAKRPLTAEEQQEAQRLKAAWNRYKQEDKGASQTWLSAETKLGNQSLIGQYLNGGIPLNLKALLAICRVIGAKPEEISPRLSQNIPAMRAIKEAPVFSQSLAAEIGEVVFRYSLADQQIREYILGFLRDAERLGADQSSSGGN